MTVSRRNQWRAALHMQGVLGVLPSSELKRFADRALERGLYSFSLGELATLPRPIMADAGPLFENALREMGVSMPTPEDAAQRERYGGDVYDVDPFRASYYVYDDLEARPSELSFNGLYGEDAIKAFDQAVVEAAREWTARHGA